MCCNILFLVRPIFGNEMVVRQGRHPILDAKLQAVPNDTVCFKTLFKLIFYISARSSRCAFLRYCRSEHGIIVFIILFLEYTKIKI